MDAILCPPCGDPIELWSRVPSQRRFPSWDPRRRLAIHWCKTERTSSLRYRLLAGEERNDFLLTNALRADIRGGASRSGKELHKLSDEILVELVAK